MKDAVEPVECRRALLGGVPESSRSRQERVAEINDETPWTLLGRPGHLALKLVTRPGAAEVGVHLWRRQQLDERRTVPSLGLAEHEPLGSDRARWPGDGSELSHGGQPTQGSWLWPYGPASPLASRPDEKPTSGAARR